MTQRPDGGTQLYYGLYPAIVSNSTPDDLGRVEVELAWLGHNPSDESGQSGDEGEPARLRATLMSSWASANQGLLAVPEENSQVMVGFEAGNLARAYVVGACWNGRAAMPHRGDASSGSSPSATEDRRVLRTKSGNYVELDDSAGSVKVTISTSGGHKLVLDMTGNEVKVEHPSGHAITLKVDGSIDISAKSVVTVKAPSGVIVDAPTSAFNGDVICNTLIAKQGVVSPKYTPGFGNLL